MRERSVFPVIKAWERASKKTWENLSKQDTLFVAAVKDCLVAADIAGSALPKKLRDDQRRWERITEWFSEKPATHDIALIVEHRLTALHPANSRCPWRNPLLPWFL